MKRRPPCFPSPWLLGLILLGLIMAAATLNALMRSEDLPAPVRSQPR